MVKGACQRHGCQRKVKGDRAKNGAKYCSDECSKQVRRESDNRRKRVANMGRRESVAEAWSQGDTNKYARRGEVYEQLIDSGLGDRLVARELTQDAAAELLGVTVAAVSRALEAYEYDAQVKALQGKWRRSRFTEAMLPVKALRRLRELGRDPANEQLPEFGELVECLVRAYVAFSRRFFQLERERPLIEEFHVEWVRALIVAYAVGGKQLILSPPRHGKSEVLIRFCVWLVGMDPEIRIMWVCSNESLAKMMLGSVKDHLENNEQLIKALLPPGERYKPAWGSNKPWSQTEIKVAQNRVVGQKSSTLLALGRTSKILSRDVDFLVVDDLEDFDTTREAAQRQYSRNKFVEIGTRKEERTAWVYIGSRQHPDDLAKYLLKKASKDGWRVHQTSAHDEACMLDPEDAMLHTSCMLFPKIRSYRWLMEKKSESEGFGIPGVYEMRYLNRPIPTTGIVFDVPRIRGNLDRSRGIGTGELIPGILYAGLDPSSRNTQAAFCWHYGNKTISMVDLAEQHAGGFEGALRIIREWHELYGLTHWYYEDNSQQIEFFRDPRMKALKAELGLTISPHTTGRNKQDPELGISSMAQFYHNGTINLPYGTAEARSKTEVLLRQLELWTTDGVRRGAGQTDIKMASWFPFPRLIRRMRTDTVQTTIHEPATSSYPHVAGGNQPAWLTQYPER